LILVVINQQTEVSEMSDVTNLTELAYIFADKPTTTRIVGVPSLQKGETVEQAIKRRAESFKRIREKAAAKRH
jgi:hypothetical protein